MFPLTTILGLLLLVTGCRVQERPDPFRGVAVDGPGVTTHSVRFEVSCDSCSISWSVDERSGGFRDEALWSERVTVRVRRGAPVTATLSALPEANAGRVNYVRIVVDGEVAAEARAGDGPDEIAAGSTLSVTAAVPSR